MPDTEVTILLYDPVLPFTKASLSWLELPVIAHLFSSLLPACT